MSKSKIEWTDLTINPIVGCSKCSPGCENCYAEVMAGRLACMGLADYQKVIHWQSEVSGLLYSNRKAAGDCKPKWNGKTAFVPSALEKIPKRGHKRIFIGSMTDIFHESVSFEWITSILLKIRAYPQHTFQILTKRPDRMKEYFDDKIWYREHHILKNLWLGVTVCNQEEADSKIPVLLKTPAAVRFVSVEPMLGRVDLTDIDIDGYHCIDSLDCEESSEDCGEIGNATLDWVICGGEAGKGSRPLNPEWVISLRDQCKAANVPFFFKQWGEYTYSTLLKNGKPFLAPVHKKVGKKKAGNMLWGEKYEEFPEVNHERHERHEK